MLKSAHKRPTAHSAAPAGGDAADAQPAPYSSPATRKLAPQILCIVRQLHAVAGVHAGPPRRPLAVPSKLPRAL